MRDQTTDDAVMCAESDVVVGDVALGNVGGGKGVVLKGAAYRRAQEEAGRASSSAEQAALVVPDEAELALFETPAPSRRPQGSLGVDEPWEWVPWELTPGGGHDG